MWDSSTGSNVVNQSGVVRNWFVPVDFFFHGVPSPWSNPVTGTEGDTVPHPIGRTIDADVGPRVGRFTNTPRTKSKRVVVCD